MNEYCQGCRSETCSVRPVVATTSELTSLAGVTEVELSKMDVATFHRDGYLLVESVFADDELAAFRDAADRILELSINSTSLPRTRCRRLWPSTGAPDAARYG